MQIRIKDALDLIEQVQRTEIKYMCNNSVPLDLEGTMLLPVIPERMMVTKFLRAKKVTKPYLENFLFEHLQDFMQALQAQDSDQISKLCEANFAEKLLKNREAREGNEWFNFQRAEYDPEKVICNDKLLYKGVGIDRSTNGDQMDYTKVPNLEPQGMRQYIHKWDMGYQDYYYHTRYYDELCKLVDPSFRSE